MIQRYAHSASPAPASQRCTLPSVDDRDGDAAPVYRIREPGRRDRSRTKRPLHRSHRGAVDESAIPDRDRSRPDGQCQRGGDSRRWRHTDEIRINVNGVTEAFTTTVSASLRTTDGVTGRSRSLRSGGQRIAVGTDVVTGSAASASESFYAVRTKPGSEIDQAVPTGTDLGINELSDTEVASRLSGPERREGAVRPRDR